MTDGAREPHRRAGRPIPRPPPDDQPPVVVGTGVKGERSESAGHEVPFTPAPETTLLDQPGRPRTQPLREASSMEKMLFTVKETAEMLSVSRNRVYELIYAEQLASIKIGRSRRVSRASIVRFVESATPAA